MKVRRRALHAWLGLGVFAATPGGVLAAPHRVAWLGFSSESAGADQWQRVKQGLAELGWIEGRTIEFTAVWADDSRERLDQLAAALETQRPDVVVAQGPAIIALKRARATVPVVFSFSGDPVEAGVADSLPRPGRNYTGITNLSVELVGKRLQILKEALPRLARVGVVANQAHAGERIEREATRKAADALGLQFEYIPLPGAGDVQPALDAALRLRCDALLVFPDVSMMRHSERIAEFAVQHRMPAISGLPEFARRGNLLSYGPDRNDTFYRLARFVDRILRGSAPAGLPVEQPMRLSLAVNLKAARRMGVTLPRTLLLQADEVIE